MLLLIIKTGLVKLFLTIQVGKEYGVMEFPWKSQQITEKYNKEYQKQNSADHFLLTFE